MEKKVIAVICGNERELRRAWYEYLLKFRKSNARNIQHGFIGKWVEYSDGGDVVTHYFYLPTDKTAMWGQWFDEVIWYGTVKSHPKYRDVVDYVRLHSRKVGEF